MIGIFELITGILIVVGFYTIVTAFILYGQMAAAYFIAHAPKSFFSMLNDAEPAIFFCFISFFCRPRQ